MTLGKRVMVAGILLAAAVCCAVGALYLFSILSEGQGRYRDLIWPTALLGLSSACAATFSGIIWSQGRRARARLRALTLCLTGVALAASCVFYGLAANCRLWQTTTVLWEKRSPDSSLIAVHLARRGEAVVGYCPSLSRVRLIRPGGDPKTSGTLILELSEDDGLRLEWRSSGLLEISYSGFDKVTHREQRVGAIRIRYLPIPTL